MKGERDMKKLGILVVFIVMMTVFSTAHAANKTGDFSIGASVGGYFFEGNQDYKNSIAVGVRAGYNFTDNIGTEIFINMVPSEFKDTSGEHESGGENKVYVGGIEGIYNFMPNSRFVPFLAIGIGAIHYSSDDPALEPSKLTVDYGAGLKCFVTKDLALRADVRHVLPLGEKMNYGDNPDKIHNDLMATVGFSYYFGGNK